MLSGRVHRHTLKSRPIAAVILKAPLEVDNAEAFSATGGVTTAFLRSILRAKGKEAEACNFTSWVDVN